jgi:hypothetical protein
MLAPGRPAAGQSAHRAGGSGESGDLGGDGDRNPVLESRRRTCVLSRAQNYYVALNAYHFPGPRSMTMGDVVLKPDLEMPRENLKALVEHEARHRTQWAVGTAIGGPLAFPIAYGITYFFFPGAQPLRAHGGPGIWRIHPFGHRTGARSRSARRAQRPGRDHRRGSARRALPACCG